MRKIKSRDGTLKKFLWVSLLTTTSALSCLHFDRGYEGRVYEGKKEVFLYLVNSEAHMILKTNLSADKSLPERVAWVLPIPRKASKFSEEDPKIFKELHEFIEPVQKGRALRGGLGEGFSGVNSPIKIHAPEVVGNYHLQQIEIIDDQDLRSASSALDLWLGQNNFNSMPQELQKPYLKKGAVFLAIELKTAGLKSADLKPLHIAYSAPEGKISYPLRFTHNERKFDMDLYIFNLRSNDVPYFENDSKRVPFPKGAVAKSKPALAKLLGLSRLGEIYRLQAHELNSRQKKLSDLKEDPTFYE
jgi:hypothetical protein